MLQHAPIGLLDAAASISNAAASTLFNLFIFFLLQRVDFKVLSSLIHAYMFIVINLACIDYCSCIGHVEPIMRKDTKASGQNVWKYSLMGE